MTVGSIVSAARTPRHVSDPALSRQRGPLKTARTASPRQSGLVFTFAACAPRLRRERPPPPSRCNAHILAADGPVTSVIKAALALAGGVPRLRLVPPRRPGLAAA
eukprot:CAMPEP_0113670576 /NCGR_PEP_ID=MMETSP0038_2-20120614/5215_1 /TAXON_ID=2898 /ORGANISM="Cryptomonas paramecium" /LENGTH=104 /DNA_ID=CAMNT_0000586611 /DNA_START=210 /DNA_END=521 /DNA_ORIENTATION=- /assembly_acc=CAM_ASM_000170